ncbi:hypothetical protein [Pseudomonas abietaniphila]|uniref:Uncharacterized protein n=1 Tax=Pseudomonas abietaniphila TaxID=89065 RepID=A0A1G8QAK7_9PSED|nr:hypothetical protein [Pseudomonas abietaniphila]SDJ01130.1 hypothetical protein SAMN05216605_12052 [Pseudomonas abietaniphila]
MKTLLTVLASVIATLALTSFLAKTTITSGFADDVLRTEVGQVVYRWLWKSLGIVGGEDGELLLIGVVFCLMLIPSALLCFFLIGCLKKAMASQNTLDE